LPHTLLAQIIQRQQACFHKRGMNMELGRNRFLVKTSWLAEHLHDPQLRIVDMRGYVRPVARDGVQDALYIGARDEYEQEHIPGAVYIDWSSEIIDLDDAVEAKIAPPAR